MDIYAKQTAAPRLALKRRPFLALQVARYYAKFFRRECQKYAGLHVQLDFAPRKELPKLACALRCPATPTAPCWARMRVRWRASVGHLGGFLRGAEVVRSTSRASS